jgi:uncharacterized protein
MRDFASASGFSPEFPPAEKRAAPDETELSPRGGGVRIVVIHSPGPMWNDPSLRYLDAAAIEAHVEHYRRCLDEGKLAAGGPFADNGGGMMVFAREVTFEEAAEIVQRDPAVRSGLLCAELHVWHAYLERKRN